jgi:hypothetical protein
MNDNTFDELESIMKPKHKKLKVFIKRQVNDYLVDLPFYISEVHLNTDLYYTDKGGASNFSFFVTSIDIRLRDGADGDSSIRLWFDIFDVGEVEYSEAEGIIEKGLLVATQSKEKPKLNQTTLIFSVRCRAVRNN